MYIVSGYLSANLCGIWDPSAGLSVVPRDLQFFPFQHGHRWGRTLVSVTQHEYANVGFRIAIAPQNKLERIVN